MKNKILVFIIMVIAFVGCTSVYQSTQTVDDVYYSPAKVITDYQQDEYKDYTAADDRYLRMKVRNHDRWNSIDDYDYWYDSRYYNSYYGFQGYGYYPYNSFGGLYYNPFNSWNYPYCTVVYYKNPTVYFGTNNKSNLTAYRNNNYSNTNLPLQTTNTSRSKNAFTFSQNANNSKPVRLFNSGSSSSAGGRSGGFKSTGSSTTTPRPPKGGGL